MKSVLSGVFCCVGLMVMWNAFSMHLMLVNAKDRDGYTPLHHLMLDQNTTIDQVVSLLKRGARLDVQSKDKEDPYNCAILYKGNSPHGELEKGEYFYNRKVINFVHSEMLLGKLCKLSLDQHFLYHKEQIIKKSTFYVIR